MSVAGASVHIADGSNITSVMSAGIGEGYEVYENEIDLTGEIEPTANNVKLTRAHLSDEADYDLADVYTDGAGKIYFWLPTQYSVIL